MTIHPRRADSSDILLRSLIGGRLLNMSNPEHVYGSLPTSERQAQLLSHRRQESGVACRTRYIGRHQGLYVELAAQTSLIDHRPIETAVTREGSSELLHGDPVTHDRVQPTAIREG